MAMIRNAAIVALALLGCAGCTVTPEQEARARADADQRLSQAIGDRVPGKPVDCVDSTFVNGPQVIDERTVIYNQGGKIWRNEIVDGCPFLHGDPILIVELHGSQICRNDRFKVLARGSNIPSGYCRLGSFTPYERPNS